MQLWSVQHSFHTTWHTETLRSPPFVRETNAWIRDHGGNLRENRQSLETGPGTIYPTLSWLEENGYVESVVEVRGEKARKPYRITAKGLGALKEYRTVKREGLESLEWMRTVWKDM